MICPNCKKENAADSYRCNECKYGLSVRPKPQKRKPLYLGDSGIETRDQELGRTFRCTNCQSVGGKVKRISTVGSGFSRILDLQNNEFIVVSCTFCGIVQLYDPGVVDSVSKGWPLLDIILGNR